MMFGKSLLIGSMVVGMFALPSNAVVLAPGAGPVAPDQLDSFAGATFLASTGVLPFVGINALNQTVYTGTFQELVALDPTNNTTIDFLYQFQDLTGDSIGQMTTTGYNGFTTDVGYDPAETMTVYFGNPMVIPDSVSRSNSGGTISYDFATNGSVPNGSTSQLLVIETNATQYALTGTVNFIDGAVASMIDFAPATAPEPASIGLLLGGLFAAGLFFARRFQVKQE
jgi:hypothetical protein